MTAAPRKKAAAKKAAKKAPSRKAAAKKAPAVAKAADEAIALGALMAQATGAAPPTAEGAGTESAAGSLLGDELLRQVMQELAFRIIDDFHVMLDEASPQIRHRMLMSAFSRMLAFAFEGAAAKDASIDEMRQSMMTMMRQATGTEAPT